MKNNGKLNLILRYFTSSNLFLPCILKNIVQSVFRNVIEDQRTPNSNADIGSALKWVKQAGWKQLPVAPKIHFPLNVAPPPTRQGAVVEAARHAGTSPWQRRRACAIRGRWGGEIRERKSPPRACGAEVAVSPGRRHGYAPLPGGRGNASAEVPAPACWAVAAVAAGRDLKPFGGGCSGACGVERLLVGAPGSCFS